MFEKVSRSWTLVKASAGVLQSDKELLLFPVVSAICTLIVAATFILPAIGMELFEQGRFGIGSAVVAFAFYLCQYTVIFFFNTALVGAAMIRLEGGDPTVADGLRIARGKIVPILGYAAIAATVGLLLRAVGRRGGLPARIIVALLGTAWTLATFLVVPILVTRDIGPIDALKESAAMLKRTWGENIVGNAGIGLVFGLLNVLLVVALVALVVGAAQTLGSTAAISIAVLGALALGFLAVIQTALSGIYSAALYRFAVDGKAPEGFGGGELQSAFGER